MAVLPNTEPVGFESFLDKDLVTLSFVLQSDLPSLMNLGHHQNHSVAEIAVQNFLIFGLGVVICFYAALDLALSVDLTRSELFDLPSLSQAGVHLIGYASVVALNSA